MDVPTKSTGGRGLDVRPTRLYWGKLEVRRPFTGTDSIFSIRTIHFVFMIRGEQTFALGGHILQWSGVDRWLEVVVAQMKNPEITNEDMKQSASKYVHVVKELLENRIQAGREGGQV